MTLPLPVAARRATYADIEALPENLVGEIVHGALHTHPRPAPKHALAHSTLISKIASRYHGDGASPGGWIILTEPELHIGGHVLVPDLAGWRKERMSALPETAYFETVPDWICEILSPSTARLDRTEKRDLYARMGVPFLWHIDPVARIFEAFELREGQWLLTGTRSGDDTCDVPPFDAAPFDLGALWTL